MMGRRPKRRIDDEGRECTLCGIYQPWSCYCAKSDGARGHAAECNSCHCRRDKVYRAHAGAFNNAKRRRKRCTEEERAKARAYYASRIPQMRAHGRREHRQQTEQVRAVLAPRYIALVAAYFHITCDDLLGPSRQPEYAYPRQMAMWLLRGRLRLGHSQIGRLIGRDPSTVLHGITAIRVARRTRTQVSSDCHALTVRAIKERQRADIIASRKDHLQRRRIARVVTAWRPTIPTDPIKLYWHKRARQDRTEVAYVFG